MIFEAPPTKKPTSAMRELAAAFVGGELFSPTRLGTADRAIAKTSGDLYPQRSLPTPPTTPPMIPPTSNQMDTEFDSESGQ